MKEKIRKILGLAVSVSMAVSAVLPWTGVTAFAAEPLETELEYGCLTAEIPESLQENCPVDIPESVMPGETITISFPEQQTYTEGDYKWTLEYVVLCDGTYSWWSDSIYPSSENQTVTIPETVQDSPITGPIYFLYEWGREKLTQGGRPVITNFIFDVERTVTQGSEELSPTENEDEPDVYYVKKGQEGESSELTLNYDTSMDMRNLGIGGLDGDDFSDGPAWGFLQANKEYITDKTWVDLHFSFDEKIDMDTLNTDSAELISDMFVLRSDVETFEKNGHELIVHCRWDSANAMANDDLDPMIYFNGVKVGLPADWGEEDTITIANSGFVDGWVYINLYGGEGFEIDGGKTDDTFVMEVAGPTTYTVTHEYYTSTDGGAYQLDGSVTGEAVAGTVGDIIAVADIQKLTDYNGNSYSYASSQPEEELVLSEDVSQNVITLIYQREVTTEEPEEPEEPDTDPPYVPVQPDPDPDEEIDEPETPLEPGPGEEIDEPEPPLAPGAGEDAVPGGPSEAAEEPVEEPIDDEDAPKTDAPPQTGRKVAGSLALLAGAAVTAFITFRKKEK